MALEARNALFSLESYNLNQARTRGPQAELYLTRPRIGGHFICVVYGLFSYAVSSADYMAFSYGMINKQVIGIKRSWYN